MHPSGSTAGVRPRGVGAIAVIVLLTLGAAACGSRTHSSSITSNQAMADAKVIWQADLRPSTTGATAAHLTQHFIRIDGVGATRGDSGQHLWVYSTSSPTPAQISAISHQLWSAVAVDSVRRLP